MNSRHRCTCVKVGERDPRPACNHPHQGRTISLRTWNWWNLHLAILRRKPADQTWLAGEEPPEAAYGWAYLESHHADHSGWERIEIRYERIYLYRDPNHARSEDDA